MSDQKLALPERTIRKALMDGFAYFSLAENIDQLDLIFQGQETKEIASIKTVVTSWKERIVLGYPRAFNKMPVIGVVLRSENEAEGFLGDVVEADSERNSFWRGLMFDSVYGAGIFTENPDMTIALYRLCKTILLAKRNYLELNNVLVAKMSGSDIQPDTTYLPDTVCLRWLDISCKNMLVAAMNPTEIKMTTGFVMQRVEGAPDDRNVVVDQNEGRERIRPNLASFTIEDGSEEGY